MLNFKVIVTQRKGGGGAAVSFRALEFKSADPEYKSCSDSPPTRFETDFGLTPRQNIQLVCLFQLRFSNSSVHLLYSVPICYLATVGPFLST